MKQVITIILPIILLVFSFVFLMDNKNPESRVPDANSVMSISIPGNIQTILDNSCMGCHNSESKNTKGKNKLNFDKFTNDGYSKGKLIGKLDGIVKTLKKGDMPPKKFLEKYPDRMLSTEDVKVLSQWATSEADKLMSE